ncbi:hypothetical protein Scep_000837 [Stephania cephalantha]|uniref:Uncharacterized protein n=1 Tax=Stephania cephalantha TaxID=152367 RepID=A0AAP0L7C9_9MAGN
MGSRRGGGTMLAEAPSLSRPKFGRLLGSDPSFAFRKANEEDESTGYSSNRNSSASSFSAENSPYEMSPWNNPSPFAKSPWTAQTTTAIPGSTPSQFDSFPHHHGLICSLVREEGHIYSLAASGDLLYTGSDSKNIRVWKNQKDFSGFKSNSGLVKAIVVSTKENKIFTGHQDGKIRVWKVSEKNPSLHKRIGTLPKMKDYIKSSIKPSNYVQVRRNRNALWIKHFDAVSCLSLDEEEGLLYSGSWDKTVKVWRISDAKCLESINAHEDAVNSVVVAGGVDGLVFTGSADGTAKAWRRDYTAKGATKHTLEQTLLRQESAVTSLAISPSKTFLYCGSSDGLVNFWARAKAQLSHGGALRGHKQAVLCLAAAGNLLFSGSADKTICVWRRDAGLHTCLAVLTGHNGPVKCLAVERDQEQREGREEGDEDLRWILYSGSLDKSVKVWRVSEHSPDFQQHQRY